jgi:hypothetical protein
MTILDCMDENLRSRISDSDDKICDNEESGCKSDISDSEQCDRQVAPLVSGLLNVKW